MRLNQSLPAYDVCCVACVVCVTQVESKAREIDSEKHLKSLAEREAGRLKSDMQKLGAERAELQEKVTHTHTHTHTQAE